MGIYSLILRRRICLSTVPHSAQGMTNFEQRVSLSLHAAFPELGAHVTHDGNHQLLRRGSDEGMSQFHGPTWPNSYLGQAYLGQSQANYDSGQRQKFPKRKIQAKIVQTSVPGHFPITWSLIPLPGTSPPLPRTAQIVGLVSLSRPHFCSFFLSGGSSR